MQADACVRSSPQADESGAGPGGRMPENHSTSEGVKPEEATLATCAWRGWLTPAGMMKT